MLFGICSIGFFLLGIVLVIRMVGRNYDDMGWASFSPQVFLDVLIVPCLPPTWFLSALFCIFLIAPLLAYGLRDSKIACAVGMLAVCGLFLGRSDLWEDRCFHGLVWFAIGNLFAQFDLLNFGSVQKKILLSGVCILALSALLVGRGEGLMFCLLMASPSREWPAWIVGNSFHLYLLHYFFVLIFASTFVSRVAMSIGFIGRFVCIVGASLIIVQAMRCLLPKSFFKIIFGSR